MKIGYDHPKYKEIEGKARWIFKDRMSPIPLTLLERAYPYLADYVVVPECPDCDSERFVECPRCEGEGIEPCDACGVCRPQDCSNKETLPPGCIKEEEETCSNCDGEGKVECVTCDGIEPGHEDEPIYPMWGTCFHVNDPFLANWIQSHPWELHEECGLNFFDDLEDFSGPVLFVCGEDYDFYEAHWIPLFLTSGLMDIEKYTQRKEFIKYKDLISGETFEENNPKILWTYPNVDFANNGVSRAQLDDEPTTKDRPNKYRTLAWVLEEETEIWWPSEIIK